VGASRWSPVGAAPRRVLALVSGLVPWRRRRDDDRVIAEG
jgi:hypothetical protein